MIFLSNSQQLVSASFGGRISLCDCKTGAALQNLQSPGGPLGLINSVIFTPNYQRLALAALDGKMRLWVKEMITLPQK